MTVLDGYLAELASGQRHRLDDLPTLDIPRTPGVYALWHDGTLLYVGISYRDPATTSNPNARGVAGRLIIYRQARLSTEFATYVLLRWVIPQLSPDEIAQLASGELGAAGMQARTRSWIRTNVEFSVVSCLPEDARTVEDSARTHGLPGHPAPALNPKTAAGAPASDLSNRDQTNRD